VTTDLRTLVVGLGEIGTRHLRNLLDLGYTNTAVLRRTDSAAKHTKAEFGVPGFSTRTEAEDWTPDIVLISNPTSKHTETARWAVECGASIFVEKPIGHNSDAVRDLLTLAADRRKSVGVACNLRFHPALEAIRQAIQDGRIGKLLSVRTEVGHYLPDWHPDSDYRKEYAARSDLGGGALLTLIHELDYAYWIAGEVTETTGLQAHVSNLELDVDDVTEIICRHEAGAVSSVHVDFLDRAYNRRARFVGEDATIAWEWSRPVRLLAPDRSDSILWSDESFDFNDTYKREWVDFAEAVVENRPPRTPGHEGLRVLEIAESIRREQL